MLRINEDKKPKNSEKNAFAFIFESKMRDWLRDQKKTGTWPKIPYVCDSKNVIFLKYLPFFSNYY